MSKLDKKKEKIGILKFWLGIAVATLLAIIGWAVSNFGKIELWFLIVCLFTIIGLCAVAVFISRKINQHIDDLEDL